MGTDIGQLLALEHVDLKVIAAGMLADDHATINLPARLDHHPAPVLQFPHRVSHRVALVGPEQHTVAPTDDFTAMRTIGMKKPIHDSSATSIGQKFAPVADQA